MRNKLLAIKSTNLSRTISTSYPDINRWLNESWSFGESSLAEKIYCSIHDVTPLCYHGKRRRFISYKKGFSDTATGCRDCKDIINTKKIKTSFAKFGVAHHSQNSTVKEKTKSTINGTTNFYKKSSNKRKDTLLKKYGVAHQMQIKSVKDKVRRTNLTRHGYENPLSSPKIQSQISKTMMAKYGVIHALHNKEIAAKQKETITNSIKSWHHGITEMSPYSRSIIENRELFHAFVIGKSRQLIASELDVSINYINVKLREYEFEEFKNIKSSYETQMLNEFKDENLIHNSRSIIPPMEVDIFFPDHNLAVECNGNYWHSELAGGKTRPYHLEKTVKCHDVGITLLHFFEDELLFKWPIVSSMISSRLGLSSRIYARKTSIVYLNSSSEFERENHLQGVGRSKVKLGLEYNGEVVAVMTFGKTRIFMGGRGIAGEWEMIRFASKKNTSVVGGASKLFKKFISDYNPSKVISYANRRYSDGEVYNKLGFTFVHNSPPSQWYLHTSNMLNRVHRFSKRKDILVTQGYDKSKTAWEILQEIGYDRIWDCGNSKWEWSIIQRDS